jgi:predicted ferric reductase
MQASFSALERHLHSGIARIKQMLWTLCIILLVLWALGMATSYTAGGLIHILLVIAVIVLLFRVFSGRSVV